MLAGPNAVGMLAYLTIPVGVAGNPIPTTYSYPGRWRLLACVWQASWWRARAPPVRGQGFAHLAVRPKVVQGPHTSLPE